MIEGFFAWIHTMHPIVGSVERRIFDRLGIESKEFVSGSMLILFEALLYTVAEPNVANSIGRNERVILLYDILPQCCAVSTREKPTRASDSALRVHI